MLDGDGRLNVFVNSTTQDFRHYRSLDDENLNNFELIVEGNGHATDKQSYYPGVGIHNDVIYLGYVVTGYDFWLTWKSVTDTVWAPAILMDAGRVDPGGNHCVLYPSFAFHGDSVYIVASHTSDGSTYNFKDAALLYSFAADDPQSFSVEEVYPKHAGYPAFGYSVDFDDTGAPEVLFVVGEKVYGEDNPEALPPAIYIAERNKSEAGWEWELVSDESGVASRGELNGKDIILLNTNDWKGGGKLTVLERFSNRDSWNSHPIPWPSDSTKLFPNSLVIANTNNGSSLSGLDAMFSVRSRDKRPDSLYTYELYYLHTGE